MAAVRLSGFGHGIFEFSIVFRLAGTGKSVSRPEADKYRTAVGHFCMIGAGISFCKFVAAVSARIGERETHRGENFKRVVAQDAEREEMRGGLHFRREFQCVGIGALERIVRREQKRGGENGGQDDGKFLFHDQGFFPCQRNQLMLRASSSEIPMCSFPGLRGYFRVLTCPSNDTTLSPRLL